MNALITSCAVCGVTIPQEYIYCDSFTCHIIGMERNRAATTYTEQDT